MRPSTLPAVIAALAVVLGACAPGDDPVADPPPATTTSTTPAEPAATPTNTPPPAPTTSWTAPDLAITVELIGCENRVGDDQVRPVALVELTNTTDVTTSVRISGAVQLTTAQDHELYPDGWYGAGADGGRHLDPGEVYTMELNPDFRHQAMYGPDTLLACRVHHARVWRERTDLDLRTELTLQRAATGDVDGPLHHTADPAIPTDDCIERDGRWVFREQRVLRAFLDEASCRAALG